jgi:hypothetical protein
MEITGGNLRLLFGDLSLNGLEAFFVRAAQGMDFLEAPDYYFLPTEMGTQDPYHRAFTCFPKEPFDSPLELGFVSDFVMKLVVTEYENLKSDEFENSLSDTRSILHVILGFSLKQRTVRGILFEDLCYDVIISGDPGQFAFDFFSFDTRERVGELSIPEIADLQRGDISTMPKDLKPPFLWASTDTQCPGFDAIFSDGKGIYVIQISTAQRHRDCNLSQLKPFVIDWVNADIPCYFVFLGDSLNQCTAILNRKTSLIKDCNWTDHLTEYVGLLMEDPKDGKKVVSVQPRRRFRYEHSQAIARRAALHMGTRAHPREASTAPASVEKHKETFDGAETGNSAKKDD